VFFFGHSAKSFFAEDQKKNTRRQRGFFAECQKNTRQKPSLSECFFFDTQQRPSLPSAKKTLGKENFKSNFETLNKFKSKSFELQSCITSQDLQYLFWLFLYLTK